MYLCAQILCRIVVSGKSACLRKQKNKKRTENGIGEKHLFNVLKMSNLFFFFKKREKRDENFQETCSKIGVQYIYSYVNRKLRLKE